MGKVDDLESRGRPLTGPPPRRYFFRSLRGLREMWFPSPRKGKRERGAISCHVFKIGLRNKLAMSNVQVWSVHILCRALGELNYVIAEPFFFFIFCFCLFQYLKVGCAGEALLCPSILAALHSVLQNVDEEFTFWT